MQKGVFADLIVAGLTTDVSLLDSIVGCTWNEQGDELLIRVQPVNPEAWREIGELIIENLRDLVQRVRFRARLQTMNVQGVLNLIFALKPVGEPVPLQHALEPQLIH